MYIPQIATPQHSLQYANYVVESDDTFWPAKVLIDFFSLTLAKNYPATNI